MPFGIENEQELEEVIDIANRINQTIPHGAFGGQVMMAMVLLIAVGANEHMPPENRARYPKNWKTEVVPRIRARSGNRCECTGQCGQVHMWDVANPGRCSNINGFPIDDITGPCFVLTVMHLNHQPED